MHEEGVTWKYFISGVSFWPERSVSMLSEIACKPRFPCSFVWCCLKEECECWSPFEGLPVTPSVTFWKGNDNSVATNMGLLQAQITDLGTSTGSPCLLLIDWIRSILQFRGVPPLFPWKHGNLKKLLVKGEGSYWVRRSRPVGRKLIQVLDWSRSWYSHVSHYMDNPDFPYMYSVTIVFRSTFLITVYRICSAIIYTGWFRVSSHGRLKRNRRQNANIVRHFDVAFPVFMSSSDYICWRKMRVFLREIRSTLIRINTIHTHKVWF